MVLRLQPYKYNTIWAPGNVCAVGTICAPKSVCPTDSVHQAVCVPGNVSATWNVDALQHAITVDAMTKKIHQRSKGGDEYINFVLKSALVTR